jgi:hydroxymethylpyrimidine pyrophosphatase-like HAD family hydrolase
MIRTMKMHRKFPLQNVVAIDIDGTLRINGEVNAKLLAWIKEKREDGTSFMLWSMRGAAYAKEFAENNQIASLFDVICGKPGYIVDDKGWSWIKWTKVLTPFSEEQESQDD